MKKRVLLILLLLLRPLFTLVAETPPSFDLIAQGSRLRLVLRCPNSIFWEKNYNSGLRVADETSKDARTARVALYHDAEHPSMLELPLLK